MSIRIKVPGVEVDVKVPAINKLLETTASGVGGVAGSMLAPWKAKQKSKADRILAESKADNMRIITEAHAQANKTLLPSGSQSIQGDISIGEIISQRVQFQEKKRQGNIHSVVAHAASELADKEVPDVEPGHDWTAQFFNYVQDVSSDEMQHLWGKILAGEVESQGSTSIMTLNVLRNIDKETAHVFRRFCSATMSININGNIMDVRVPTLGKKPGDNGLSEYGFSYNVLSSLSEYRLIVPDYITWRDYRGCISEEEDHTDGRYNVVRWPFYFQDRPCILKPINDPGMSKQEFRLDGVALTQSGREIFKVVDLELANQYKQDLIDFFKGQGLEVRRFNSHDPF